ncbi:MAG TPA: C2H2-type zinc finger protein [candidate division Zixibacteria bacterium]|nr:C2H2-type zinc finger protein [candidate division Zixibacteria bacterium]
MAEQQASGESRPFECNYCGQAFGSEDQLRQHQVDCFDEDSEAEI